MRDPLTAWLAAIAALAVLAVILFVALDLPIWLLIAVVAIGVLAGASVSMRGR